MQPLLASDPHRVGDYRLLARLGRGAMGGVYLGRSRGGRVVAVKVIRPDLAEDPEFRERFRREAVAASSVGGFWTAAVVHADPDAEQPWLATEYVPGPTLHQAVADHGPLPEATVRGLGAGLAEALIAIHRAELVHRDLKPANVLLGPDGPRVIDFGISRAMTGSALTATGMFMGTPGFFSPEQTLGTEVGPPSDIFSLGAVLVFAATGRGPFGEESTATLLYRVAHAEPDLSEVPDGLRPLLAACLAKDPAARPTPAQMLDEIGESSPHGNQWLPPAISDVIAQHATQLQQTASAPMPDTPPPQPVAAPRPATRTYTQAAPAAPAPAPPQPAPQPPAPVAPARAEVEPVRGKIVPAQPRQTSQQPQVRRDNPGPVFATAGRFRALFSAVVCVAIMFGAYELFRHGLGSGDRFMIFQIGMLLLGLSAAWSVARAVLPSLCLKINGDGLLVSRMGLTREIPWSQVQRVGVVGSGKRASVAVWFTEGTAPRSALWHRLRPHHGGHLIFPIGATGGWFGRRQEIRRIRTALQQYAPGRYDTRML
ncbi:Serine/threonine protein kinase [Saccharopolyspora antimicrobica]|uniref:Serine/threonine protein kinase n=1 Tax=Saccharopolyspora antimicrobica TaxID=455193 RepID=A0A1I5HW71_9PSEU|nr:serine/threonine-protein kinase [Saccharopolyspora antimicrobica]RKT82298.1 serine/threonine protein kinase [Saccharopolyspora antimicrobica]SFO52220.1 Serine/threonine protein kinase [Saccharopolyspora antimicrobica]